MACCDANIVVTSVEVELGVDIRAAQLVEEAGLLCEFLDDMLGKGVQSNHRNHQVVPRSLCKEEGRHHCDSVWTSKPATRLLEDRTIPLVTNSSTNWAARMSTQARPPRWLLQCSHRSKAMSGRQLSERATDPSSFLVMPMGLTKCPATFQAS